MAQPRRFFFYGTLIGGSDHPCARIVRRHMRPIAPAWVEGDLHAVPTAQGWYPVMRRRRGARTQGMLFAARPGLATRHLALLDRYEECRRGCRTGSLYWRATIGVVDARGRASAAQAYLYNRPLPRGARPIARGAFAAWLAQTGMAAYAPRRGHVI